MLAFAAAGMTAKTGANGPVIGRCIIMRIVAGGTGKSFRALYEAL
jgi:hypothetical protein